MHDNCYSSHSMLLCDSVSLGLTTELVRMAAGLFPKGVPHYSHFLFSYQGALASTTKDLAGNSTQISYFI